MLESHFHTLAGPIGDFGFPYDQAHPARDAALDDARAQAEARRQQAYRLVGETDDFQICIPAAADAPCELVLVLDCYHPDCTPTWVA